MADRDALESAKGAHQNIARTVLVLEVLAKAENRGVRFADVVRLTGLGKAVVHRCLAGLTAHGLACFEQDGGRFFLGDRLFAWTVAAGKRYELAERAAPFLRRLADETEDTAYFMVRRGDHAICYGRAVGSFPVKTLTVNFADRRPLGIGACPLAILAALDDAEVDRLMRVQAEERAPFGLTDGSLRRMIGETRQCGYSFNDGLFIPGMRGMAVPVRNARGEPVAALGVAAISLRLERQRREQLAVVLGDLIRQMGEEFPQLLEHPGRIARNGAENEVGTGDGYQGFADRSQRSPNSR